jgi:copper(I)-binding protein
MLLVSGPALAGPVNVSDAWFRFLPAHLPAGGYFTVVNTTRRPLDITAASSPACAMLMLHKSGGEGGMSSMAMVDKVTVPAGGTLKFTPGGYHLMCDGAKMTVGGKAPVTLSLSDGSSVTAAFAVRDARGK